MLGEQFRGQQMNQVGKDGVRFVEGLVVLRHGGERAQGTGGGNGASGLFPGVLRDGVMLGFNGCVWRGCSQPPGKCEADHVLRWGTAGPTTTHNGAPTCGHHNRWRTRGYRTWRDPTGRWHHYRPDNTEIGWRTPQRNGKAS